MIGAVRPEVASRARHQPERAGRHGHARPAFGGARLRSHRGGRAAHDDQHHLLDLAPLPAARRPTRCARSRPFRASTRRATWSPTTTRPPGSACAGCGTSFTPDEPAGFERLIELAEGSPPGSGGVIFTPWIAGERSPVDDRNARGGWHNLSVETGNADLVRSVLEGVAYNSRWLNEAVERFAKRRLDPLRIFGGGADSRPLVPDPRRRHGPDDRARRRADARQPPRRGAVRRPRARRGLARRGPRPRAGRSGLQPGSRRHRATTTASTGSSPGLYKAQRKMFARLNG